MRHPSLRPREPIRAKVVRARSSMGAAPAMGRPLLAANNPLSINAKRTLLALCRKRRLRQAKAGLRQPGPSDPCKVVHLLPERLGHVGLFRGPFPLSWHPCAFVLCDMLR